MILVIGGNSTTGRELIRLLRSQDAPVRVMARDPGPDQVYGDLAKPATLDVAMQGAGQGVPAGSRPSR